MKIRKILKKNRNKNNENQKNCKKNRTKNSENRKIVKIIK